MSINLPVRQLARSASTMPSFTSSVRPRVVFQPMLQRRTLFGFLKRKEVVPLDPLSEEFTRRKQPANSLPPPQRGDLAGGSIFDDGDKGSEATPGREVDSQAPAARDTSVRARDPALMEQALNPRPEARRRWQQKMVIREVQRRGRIGRATLIARNEREHLARSAFIKTSIKKLMPLARQIAGKPVDEAIVQMRFSRKKAAADVLRHLERARDEATVVRGMGLGKASAGGAQEDGTPERMLVVDKKGHKRVVTDKTAMYVDQAWVGRGSPDYGIDYRAQGRMHRLTRPFTSISLLLKEEKTRIREQNERADKEAKRKPWVPLPDRPVTRQTQYPLW